MNTERKEPKRVPFTIIDRRAGKSQRTAWKIAFRAFIWDAWSFLDELKKFKIHNYTADQYISIIVEKKYWKPLKIKDKYKNIIDDTIKLSDSWSYLTKRERRAIMSVMLFLMHID
jgi:hypothetical protein